MEVSPKLRRIKWQNKILKSREMTTFFGIKDFVLGGAVTLPFLRISNIWSVVIFDRQQKTNNVAFATDYAPSIKSSLTM